MDSALRQSEVRYRRVFETAKDGILILNGDTVKIIDANPFMTELLGYSHDEFLDKELWEIGLFADKRASQAVYEKLQEKGYVRYDNLPLQSKSGKKAEVEFVSNVYREGDHPVIQCNIRDIGERIRLERELKAHDRRFRILVEQVKDYAIFMTDTERRATSWNEGVQQVLGFGEDEWIGRDIVPLIFTPAAIADGIAQKEFDDAEAHGRAGDDRWMVQKGGTRFFALGILTALRDDDGTLLGFTKVVRDQTDRKRLEDDLHRHAEQLAEQHRRKDEFLAMLGHELRNPLAHRQRRTTAPTSKERGSTPAESPHHHRAAGGATDTDHRRVVGNHPHYERSDSASPRSDRSERPRGTGGRDGPLGDRPA